MFIRTKDRIYEIEKLNLDKIVGNIKYEIIDNKLLKTMYGYEAHLFEYDIIDKADTIEELCDTIVYYDCDLECVQITWLKGKNVANFKRHFDYVKMGGIKDVKGAILTNEGIIYTADMNNEGKLILR